MGGNSSRAVFCGVINQLLQAEVPSTHHEFWDELWKSTLSVEDIFELISSDDIRKLMIERPNNIKTLFTQAVAQLYQVVETPYPVYFDQALNCARILARILPIMMEVDSKFVRDLFWSRQLQAKAKVDDNSNEVKVDDVPETHETEPLAVILVNGLFHLLFLPDFTIEDPNTDFSEEDLNSQEFKNALMWAPGVGSNEKSVVSSTQYDKNRIDILRVMIAAFSEALYHHPDNYDSCSSMWLEVATSSDAPYAEIVLYSLMNTVLGYDPIGWGLPYGNLIATDTAKLLMESAVQSLIILLDYGHPIRYQKNGADNEPINSQLPYIAPNDTEAQGFNVFRKIMGTIESPDQLNFIFRGFVRLLNNSHQSESSYLPYSITRVTIEQELLILLWKCLEEIPKFMPFILRQCDVTEILVPVCYFMLEGRKDPSKIGLMYLCTFILLKLSGERNFGVSLNKPYQLRLPVDIPLFTGSHADLLIIVLHKMIVSGLDKLSALYNCFLTIICNVSPYSKSLSTVAAVKLVNLFQLFTSPKFLYASEGNHIYVSMLLETFNNIVQYQYEGNVHVVYAIVKRKEVFEALANLTLPVAIQSATDLEDKRKMEEKKLKKGRRKNKAAANDEMQELPTDSAPTEFVSTESVERIVKQSGEVEECKTITTSESTKSPAAVGRFVPSQTWLDAVKADLPLNTLMRLLRHLVPQMDELVQLDPSLDEGQLLDFIRQTTLVGLLPVPHPIVIRKYQPNKYTCLWFTAFMWGVIFMHNQEIPLFDGKKVKLFMVETT